MLLKKVKSALTKYSGLWDQNTCNLLVSHNNQEQWIQVQQGENFSWCEWGLWTKQSQWNVYDWIENSGNIGNKTKYGYSKLWMVISLFGNKQQEWHSLNKMCQPSYET